MEAEVERFAGAAEAAGVPPAAALAGSSCTAVQMPPLHRHQLRLAAPAAAPGPGPARRPRRLRPARRPHRPLPARRHGCAGSSPSRRCTPAYRRPAPSPPTPSSPTWTPSPGVYFPRGGMHALPRAMADAAADAGADVPLRPAEVTAAGTQRPDRVTRRASPPRERIPCDAVVLTPDLPVVHRLLGRAPAPPAAGCATRPPPWSCTPAPTAPGRSWRTTPSPSAPPGSGTFDELTRTGRLMSDPSLLITRPTASRPALAPPGRHLHYVLAPCPNTDIGPGAAAWRDLGPRYRDSLVAELERRGLDRHRRRHRGGAAWSPPPTGRPRGIAAGTPFSAAHTFAPDRPVPPPQPRARHGQRRAGGLRHHPRRRRPHRPDLRQARRRPHHRPAAPPRPTAGTARSRPDEAARHDRSRTGRRRHHRPRPARRLRPLPPAQRPARQDLLPRHPAAARRNAAAPCTPCTASPAGPTTSSTTSGHRPHRRRPRTGARRPPSAGWRTGLRTRRRATSRSCAPWRTPPPRTASTTGTSRTSWPRCAAI